MWRPRDYAEIEAALGAVSESAELDFKRELSKPTEIAKDIAAMSLQGGVIAYGIDEDPQTGLALELTPITLAKVPERVQQIVDTAIWPKLEVGIELYPATPGGADGVVLVTTPPSPLAPHYANNRFPARSDRTTRYLSEREIGALYEQRRELLNATEPGEILADFTYPAGAPPAGIGFGGIGIMRVLVAPVAPAPHPDGVRLSAPLQRAVTAAGASNPALRQPGSSVAFDLIKGWRPRGAIGWEAGQTFDNYSQLAAGRTSAVVCDYALRMSFFAAMSLNHGQDPRRYAFEHLWAAEVLAQLAIAGEFLAQVPLTSILRAELGVQGFDNALAHAVEEGYGGAGETTRTAPEGYAERTQTSARELADEPMLVARRLLDRFFVSFVPEACDPFALIDDAPRSAA
jgi:hypothetical protein